MISFDAVHLPQGTFLTGDPAAWDCALIVRPETPASDMRAAFTAVRLAGMEPIPVAEHEPELLPDGTVRWWLVPVDAEDPFTEDQPEEITA
ncbi:hypothetical protein ACIRSU_25495 [Streptomyces sp. NPDC101160]|uniref:hypothetical protein n=1 Tax=Streptomyces sp. NPDC101160 TaxID=3366118 RepID=UPI0037F12057